MLDPKIIQKTLDAIEQLKKTNPFLAELIWAQRKAPNEGLFLFGTREAKAVIDTMRMTPSVLSARSCEELTASPDIFWDLIDNAKRVPQNDDYQYNRAVMGIFIIFSAVERKGLVSEGFRIGVHSPAIGLRHEMFWRYLDKEYICRENFCALEVGNPKLSRKAMFFMHMQSAFLRDFMIANRKNIFPYTNNALRIQRIYDNIESWMGAAGTIYSVKDVTVDRLDAIIESLRNIKEETERTYCLTAVFRLWIEFMRSNPDTDFFRDSPLWMAECVMNAHTPIFISRGYKVVAAGKTHNLYPYDKVLFVVKNYEFRTASGNNYFQKAVTFTDIKNMTWRRIYVNFTDSCIARGVSVYNLARNFVLWYQGRTATFVRDRYFISREDMKDYRAYIFTNENIKDSSQGVLINVARTFLRWCEAAGYVELEARALVCMAPIKNESTTNRKSVAREDIPLIYNLLLKEYKRTTSVRYLYTALAYCIQNNSEARIGEICSLRLSNMRFNDDGTCTAKTKSKNGGAGIIERHFNATATDYIHEAMDASREIRDNCPRCEFKDAIFLYIGESDGNFRVLDVNAFNFDLKNISRIYSVERYSSGNVRHTFMSGIKRLGRNLGLHQETVLALVGHSRMETTNGYDNIELTDILEASDNISLGKTPSSLDF